MRKVAYDNDTAVPCDLQDQLRSESTRQLGYINSNVVNPELQHAALELRLGEDIILRPADESSLYVTLNQQDKLTNWTPSSVAP